MDSEVGTPYWLAPECFTGLYTEKADVLKIKGAICNVPVECDQTCNQLPHPPDRSCIIILKLKGKLQSREVYFQASRPELIQQVLNWLKVHNHCTKIY